MFNSGFITWAASHTFLFFDDFITIGHLNFISPVTIYAAPKGSKMLNITTKKTAKFCRNSIARLITISNKNEFGGGAHSLPNIIVLFYRGHHYFKILGPEIDLHITISI